MLRRTRGWVGGSIALVALAGGSWWMGSRFQSSTQAAAKAEPPAASWITVQVERRMLRSTVVSRGVAYAAVSIELQPPSSVEGDPVVTRQPPPPGTKLHEGEQVIEVSGRPVFLMGGSLPVYRSLRPGMSGADVGQLQDSLRRLGYSPDEDGTFGEATKNAVSAFYSSAGYAPEQAETTALQVAAAKSAFETAQSVLSEAEYKLKLAQSGKSPAVVSAQAAVSAALRALEDSKQTKSENVAAAERALKAKEAALEALARAADADLMRLEDARAEVMEAQSALASAVRQSDNAVANAEDQVRVATAFLAELQQGQELVRAEVEVADAKRSLDARAIEYLATVAASGPTVPRGEVVFSPAFPVGLEPFAGSDGQSSSDQLELPKLVAGNVVVRTSIPVDGTPLEDGAVVDLLDERTGARYPASVVLADATPSLDAEGRPVQLVTVVPNSDLPLDLVGVEFRVTFVVDETAAPVIAVPISAVSSSADGVSYVSVLRTDEAVPVRVPVVALMSADGFVGLRPITPGSLPEGTRVIVGQ